MDTTKNIENLRDQESQKVILWIISDTTNFTFQVRIKGSSNFQNLVLEEDFLTLQGKPIGERKFNYAILDNEIEELKVTDNRYINPISSDVSSDIFLYPSNRFIRHWDVKVSGTYPNLDMPDIKFQAIEMSDDNLILK